MPEFSRTEQDLIILFGDNEKFTFKNTVYKLLEVDKPTISSGECKTDIYLKGENLDNGSILEIKISVKQKNADFLENKMKLERAIEIFGKDAQEIIFSSLEEIKEDFLNTPWVYFEKKGKTEKGVLTIGWKFELLNKPSGSKSGELLLSEKQKMNIYAGIGLSSKKCDATVNGKIIKNSGIANYILVTDGEIDVKHNYLNDLIEMSKYVEEKKIYFACKALNYRSSKDKWDGNRPLAAYIDWSLDNDGILSGKLILKDPLSTKGNCIGKKIQEILKRLKIDHSNFIELDKHLHSEILKIK